jgi:hypothetical protein
MSSPSARYIVQFELDSEGNPELWHWTHLLRDVEGDIDSGDVIDYSTLKVGKIINQVDWLPVLELTGGLGDRMPGGVGHER